MAKIIDDETMENVCILAKLSLSEEEKEKAKAEMQKMLDYVEKLDELIYTACNILYCFYFRLIYGSRRFISRGKRQVSRTFSSPISCMVRRSSPIPSPP